MTPPSTDQHSSLRAVSTRADCVLRNRRLVVRYAVTIEPGRTSTIDMGPIVFYGALVSIEIG